MSDSNNSANPTQATSTSEQWMTLEELEENFHQDWDHSDDPDAWLRIGSYRGHPVYLSHDRARTHVLLVGAGTTRSTASGLASFLHYFHDTHLSLVFFDPTSELKRLLSPELSKTHEIVEIAPETPGHSLKYNPFAYIPSSLTQALRGTGSLQSNRYTAAYSLAAVYIRYTRPVLPERFIRLSQHAQGLVTACVLHLTATRSNPPFQSLANLLLQNEQLLPILNISPDQQARGIAQRLQSLSDDYRSALFLAFTQSASLLAKTQASSDINHLTAHNTIDFASLLRKPVALFYTLPPFDIQEWQLITALFYHQLTTTLHDRWSDWETTLDTEEAEETQAFASPRGIRIIIDQPEMLGPFPRLEEDVNGWPDRAVNISFVLGIQGRSVLEKLYGQDARNMLSAFRTHIALPGISQADSNFYAARYGYSPQLGNESRTATQAHAEQLAITRPLITPMELSRLKSGRALLCPLDLPPAIISYP